MHTDTAAPEVHGIAPNRRTPGRHGPLARPAATIARLGRAVLDLLLPPLCPACRRPLADAGTVCHTCWKDISFIDHPFCSVLGIPFAYDLGPDALSAEAIAAPPPYDRARAAVTFGPVARSLVHALKYQDRLETAGLLGNWMARIGADILADADVLVPVPLHRRRLFARRYNQAALLAQAIARRSGVPVDTAALARVRATAQQVGLTAGERAENVRGAFRVTDGARVAGKSVVLVDDVLTSGATVAAATRALRRAGAARVDVLVFARVASGTGEPL